MALVFCSWTESSRRSNKGWSVSSRNTVCAVLISSVWTTVSVFIHPYGETDICLDSPSLLSSSAGSQIQSTRASLPLPFYFNCLIHSITNSSLPSIYCMWTSPENTMCTFSLIKRLDTLPCPCRKAPFICSYWIVLSVSVLFNFALQFVFITGQQKASVGNLDNGTRSLSVSPWAMIRLDWSALPAQYSAPFLHHRTTAPGSDNT